MYKNNLWRALLAIFSSNSIVSFLLNLDRFGNALCGGHYNTTVSGRVGYFSMIKANRYWSVLERMIDFTFYPIDGHSHCFNAFVWESERLLNHRRSSDVALFLLSVVVFLACFILFPFTWLYGLITRRV